MPKLGVVTGLASESALIDGLVTEAGGRVVCAGAAANRAAAAATALLAWGANGLLSFGIAGGLSADLPSGTVVLAETVVAPDGCRFATDAVWRTRLADRLGTGATMDCSLAGVDAALTGVTAKSDLARRTGAAAVDMESHAVARVAAAKGVPFLAIRAVADPAGQALPAWLTQVIDATGRPRLGQVFAGLTRRPHDLAALVRLGRQSRLAEAALRRIAFRAGPFFELL